MSSLKFKKRSPGVGYINTNLVIPKDKINVAAAKQALTFVIGEETVIDYETNEVLGTQQKTYELWDETSDHLVVPREFLSRKARKRLGIPWEKDRHVSITVPFEDNIVLRDERQEAAFAAMMRGYGGTLHLACGRGKSVLALKKTAARKVPTLIVVNTTALVEQWRGEIIKHLGIPAKEIGIIQGNECNWEGCRIAIAMVHSLSNRRLQWTMEFRKWWGLVVFDELHHLSAPHFVKSADLFFGERIGLTATAIRTDRLEAIYQYHIGRVFYTDLEQDLIPTTFFHEFDWQVPAKDASRIRDKTGNVCIPKVRSYVGSLEWRNNVIVERLYADLEEGRHVLVLSHSKDGIGLLYALFDQRVEGYASGLITGDVKEERIPILRGCNPVFGTFQLAREGLDKPVLDTLYVTTPFSNSNDLQQAWGRIQRMFDGKNAPIVRVWTDKQIGCCRASSRILKKYLKAMAYPIKSIKEKKHDEGTASVGNDRGREVPRQLRGVERRSQQRQARPIDHRLAVSRPH